MKRTKSTTAGYVILGLLALPDVMSLLGGGGGDSQPPLAISVIGTVLGVATLVALFSIVRTRRAGQPPMMVRTVAATRALSALLGIPVFFIDVDSSLKVTVAVMIALSVVGLALVRADVASANLGTTVARTA